MFFKIEYTIIDLQLLKDENLTINTSQSSLVKIKLRVPNKKGSRDSHCSASTERNVSDKNEEVFKAIEANTLSNKRCYASSYYDQTGNIIYLPRSSDMPQGFKDYIKSIDTDLTKPVEQLVDLLRWRMNIIGRDSPLSSTGLVWSRDEIFWHPINLNGCLTLTAIKLDMEEFDGEKLLEIESFLEHGIQAPLHHEVFREAWNQKHSNPRSSLLNSISALEIAVKYTISALLPKSTWMVENLPSPPIEKVLSSYIPSIATNDMFNSTTLKQGSDELKIIRKGITIRNQLIHNGKSFPSQDTIKSTLLVVRKLLWILEYYVGNEWALQYAEQEPDHEIIRKR